MEIFRKTSKLLLSTTIPISPNSYQCFFFVCFFGMNRPKAHLMIMFDSVVAFLIFNMAKDHFLGYTQRLDISYSGGEH